MEDFTTLKELLSSQTEPDTDICSLFTDISCEILIEADIIDVPVIVNFEVKIGNYKYLISFYELESDKPEIILGTVLISDDKNSKDLLKKDIDKYISYLKNFVMNSLNSGLYKKLKEEKHFEISDLSESIYKDNETISKIRLILVTNLNYVGKELPAEKYLDKEIIFDIWDEKRFDRFLSSGTTNPQINLDLNQYGKPIPCIKARSMNGIYDSYLAFFEGSSLEKIYDQFGTRLLERNVRAFLQTRGKINRDIQTTIKDTPEYFLAYNNGLTITCEDIEIVIDNEGNSCIEKINDFQIVNGGQTTASLWHAKRKFKDIDLESIQVIAKINLLKDKEKIDQLASNISLYSNSQNKVNRADPHGNKDYYRELEKVSRSVSTPENVVSNAGTRWFYERVRGAYAEEKNRKSNVSEINAFLKEFPPQQKIDKSQGAKLENTWKLLPFFVSKGAQWNFLKHSELIELEGSKPDSNYYKRLVAKQLIWKKAEKIISNQKIPGYRANIVTYSLATIVHITGNKIDLLGIWNEQDISEKLEECINRIGYEVRDIITNGTGNVTEYCKKEACWNKIKNNIRELPNDFDEILAVGLDAYKQNSEFQPINEEVEYALGINGQTWKHLASWGKHTGILDNREKGICMSIGIKITKDQTPTTKQAHAGKIIYEKAIKNGYNPD